MKNAHAFIMHYMDAGCSLASKPTGGSPTTKKTKLIRMVFTGNASKAVAATA